MKFGRMGLSGLMKASAAAVTTFVTGSLLSAAAMAETLKDGQPTDKAYGFQPAATEVAQEAHNFYNNWLFPVITLICLLVAGLLVWIMVRYNRKANPNAARFSHNTLVEIIWTVGPVIILIITACISLPLLKKFNDMPKPYVVVKATGNQWFWTYDYPELGVTDVEARLRPEASDLAKAKAAGIPYLLETDNQLVVPVNRVVHIQTTGADVIHSWTVPAFGIKMDAIPGRLNNTWFKATRTGTFYGECSELCGKDHAFMPIEVKVVSDAEFDAWIKSQGGKTPEEAAAAAAAAAAQASAAPSAEPAVAGAALPADTNASASGAAPASAAASGSASSSAVTVSKAAGPAAGTGKTSASSASAGGTPTVN